MAHSGLNLLGHEGYFALPFAWVYYQPDPRTGCMPGDLKYARWHVVPPPQAGWEGQAEHLIADLEAAQQRGDLDAVAENLRNLNELSARLQNQADHLANLVERAKAITARHEPSAGERTGI